MFGGEQAAIGQSGFMRPIVVSARQVQNPGNDRANFALPRRYVNRTIRNRFPVQAPRGRIFFSPPTKAWMAEKTPEDC